MNTFDIISIIIFALFIIICAFKGFMKILAKWGAFFVAMACAKPLGSYLGVLLLGNALGSFAPIIGTVLTFILLYIACRIIFGFLAKLITKALNSGAVDHILGAIVGAVGGIATVYLFAFVCEIIMIVVGFFDSGADIIINIQQAEILKYFLN